MYAIILKWRYRQVKRRRLTNENLTDLQAVLFNDLLYFNLHEDFTMYLNDWKDDGKKQMLEDFQ